MNRRKQKFVNLNVILFLFICTTSVFNNNIAHIFILFFGGTSLFFYSFFNVDNKNYKINNF